MLTSYHRILTVKYSLVYSPRANDLDSLNITRPTNCRDAGFLCIAGGPGCYRTALLQWGFFVSHGLCYIADQPRPLASGEDAAANRRC